jgi:anti-anti-sigma factor
VTPGEGIVVPTPFDLKTAMYDGLAVMAVVGQLDCATAPRLSEALAEMAEPGRVILVDLSGTVFIDCAGLAPLAAACGRQRQLGGDLVLDAPTAAVSRVIECTQLDKVVTVASGPSRSTSNYSRDVPTVHHRQLSDADRRRDAVLGAARTEFAEWGYHGATTAAIATRADISQSYIYALFPSKKDLFIACYRWHHRQIMDIMATAAEAPDLVQARARMNQSYADKVQNRNHFLFRLQATAAAASDEDIAAEVRQAFIEGSQKLVDLLDDDVEAAKAYIALSRLIDVAMAIELPRELWPALPAG